MIIRNLSVRLAASLLLGASVLPPVLASDDYAQLRESMRAAMAEEDFEAALAEIDRALVLRPNAPYLLGTRATLQARLGHADAALATVDALTDLSVRVDISQHEAFAGVRERDAWPAIRARQEALDQPVGDYSVVATVDQPTFVPEGVAVDGQGRIYLGSIRHGHILRVDGEQVETLVEAGSQGLASVFGLRLDEANGMLWVSTAVVPQAAEPDAERAGHSGIVRFDLASGKPVDAYWLAEDGAEHILGDLILLDEHRAVATDSLSGAIVELDVRSGEFTELLEPGRLSSPQGIVLDQARGAWFVADWVEGLFRLDRSSGQLIRVDAGDGVMLYGIDGLYLHEGDLIAVQNLAAPHRVTRIELDDSGYKVTGQEPLLRNLAEFDEPTLGVIHDGAFYLNANSQWNRFTAENDLPPAEELTGPTVLRISLPN